MKKLLLVTVLLSACSSTPVKSHRAECEALEEEMVNGQTDVDLPAYCQTHHIDPKML